MVKQREWGLPLLVVKQDELASQFNAMNNGIYTISLNMNTKTDLDRAFHRSS